MSAGHSHPHVFDTTGRKIITIMILFFFSNMPCMVCFFCLTTFTWCLQLPDRHSAPWRLVFSTRLHGESFTRMVGGLMKQGPTLLLIKDTKGHMFGGFASHGWEIKPQFQGKRSFKTYQSTTFKIRLRKNRLIQPFVTVHPLNLSVVELNLIVSTTEI